MSALDTLLASFPPGNPNSKLDTDGFPPAQPFQCYDVFIQYIRILTGNPSQYFVATQTGYAQDIYTMYDSSPLLQSLFTRLEWSATGQRGDVAVWGKAPQTPYSHVAILEADNGTTQHIYGQNQPSPFCTERDLTSTGLLGYLRPKTAQVNQPSQGGDMVTNQDQLNKLYDAVLHRQRGAGEGEDVYLNKDSGFVFNDLYASSERAQHLASESQQLADLTNQLAQAYNDRDVARTALTQTQTDTTADKTTIADLQTKLDTANATIADLQAKLSAPAPSGGFKSAPPVVVPTGLKIAVDVIITFIKQVLGAQQ